jgi:hypothetical protein
MVLDLMDRRASRQDAGIHRRTRVAIKAIPEHGHG